ncbi:MAG: hypothetical protein CR991_02425 [Proteobacteria bacterium]|nr:MAG: hypothetical protein CR991_02425 [Pseudomonadota bacterium]
MQKKYWLPLFWRWVYYAGVWTAVFWLTDWDMRIAAWFYHPACSPQGWLLDCYPMLYYLFYASIPLISSLILLGSLGVIGWTLWRNDQQRLRRQVLYFLLVFVLGSGVLVNAVFKGHWGRPRPVQIEELGGTERYVPPVQYVAHSDGHSFPSGHSSIGFGFIALYFIWRRSHPLWARRLVWASVLFGCLIGFTRMAAGGHFLSDVMWSAFLMLFTAYCLSRSLLMDFNLSASE